MDKWQQFNAKQKVLAVPDQHLYSGVPTFMGIETLKTLWFPPRLPSPTYIFALPPSASRENIFKCLWPKSVQVHTHFNV